jgi:hypothetical protein
MNCPHCKSSYTEVEHTYEDLDGVKTEYYCTACSKRFTHETKKDAPKGELVMELVDGRSYSGEYEHIVHFYLTSEGELIIKQKSSELDRNLRVTGYKFLRLRHKPRFKLSKSRWGNSLEYNSFRTLNDSHGTLFSVRGLKMYGVFLEKAKTNEAMRIVLRPDFLNNTSANEKVINDAANFLNSLLSSYPLEQISAQNSNNTSSSGGGCYVATCVYGSYDCPQVWTLRRFRDDTLASTWYGRLFIRTYYAISPTLVKMFGNTKWFKKICKGRLDHLVQKLQDKGVESIPYYDKK